MTSRDLLAHLREHVNGTKVKWAGAAPCVACCPMIGWYCSAAAPLAEAFVDARRAEVTAARVERLAA